MKLPQSIWISVITLPLAASRQKLMNVYYWIVCLAMQLCLLAVMKYMHNGLLPPEFLKPGRVYQRVICLFMKPAHGARLEQMNLSKKMDVPGEMLHRKINVVS